MCIRDRSCTQYTDPAKLITINTGDYHADIYFDRLEDMPLSNIRQVFKLLLADPWSNEGAIRQMTPVCLLYTSRCV